jgi:catechol 2,3-dioxygenase-like lactoylglutathione lyase family enzyme
LIQVFDMPASVHFDRDVLGFEVVTASGPVPNCGWALLRRNTDEIMLNTQFEDDDRPAVPDGPRQRAHHDTCFYFGCGDLDAAYAHLQAKGVAAKKPSIAPYGMRQLYFADPDGFNLCFQHPVSRETVERWRQWYGVEPR